MKVRHRGYSREAFHFIRKSLEFHFPSKKSHLMLDMGEQDAITPLASGENQPPQDPQGSLS